MILVVGATGAMGGAVVARLRAAGRPVRAMTRDPARAAHLAAAGAEVVRGDLLDRESLASACRGATAVVAAAHSIFGRGRTASEHVDGRGHRDLIDAARAAGVRRFVHTSLYDHGPAWRAVPFVRIKLEVEGHLKASGLAWTILRPTAFMESHAHKLLGEPLLRTGKVALFGRGDQPRNFVAADDVARVAVQALDNPALEGRTIDVGGPDNASNMDVVRLYERASGRTARVTHVPVGVLRVASRALRPLHPGISQIMEMGIVGDATDQSFDATALWRRFGGEPVRLADWVSRHA